MTKIFPKILLIVFNFFGILNLKVTKSGLIKNSKLCVALNVAKVVILLCFKDYFKTVINNHLLSDYPLYELTTFAEIFFSVHTDYMFLNTVMFICLQIWKSEDILQVLNEMMILRNLFMQKYKVAEKLYNQMESRCMRDVAFFFIVTIGVFSNDFVCTMNLNWMSLVSYIIFCIPHMAIVLMTLVAYLSIQFIVICQEILIESLAKDMSESSIANYVGDIGYEIGKLISLFSKMNNILNTQISLMFINYLSETIVQV